MINKVKTYDDQMEILFNIRHTLGELNDQIAHAVKNDINISVNCNAKDIKKNSAIAPEIELSTNFILK